MGGRQKMAPSETMPSARKPRIRAWKAAGVNSCFGHFVPTGQPPLSAGSEVSAQVGAGLNVHRILPFAEDTGRCPTQHHHPILYSQYARFPQCDHGSVVHLVELTNA